MLYLEKLVRAVGKLAKSGGAPVKKAAQYVSSVIFDLPIPYTEKLLNPNTAQKILNPKSVNEIVDAVVDMTKNMGQHAKALSLKATEKLKTKKSIRIGSVIKEINSIPAIKDLSRSNLTEAVAAKKAVSQVTEDLLLRSKKFVSEVELKRFIQDLDKEIPWNKLDWKLKDRILGDIRSTIDHGILKKNTNYADAMKPVEILMGNLKDISKSFSLRREGFKVGPSDSTYTKAKNFFDVSGVSKKPVTEKALAKSKEGASILEDIELSQIARRTEGGQAAGSRNIIQGLAAGSMLGLPVIGAVAGAAKDKFGRKIGKSLLPKVSGAIEKSDEALTKALGKVSPDQLERVLTKIGRVQGVKAGVEARSTNLLPTR